MEEDGCDTYYQGIYNSLMLVKQQGPPSDIDLEMNDW